MNGPSPLISIITVSFNAAGHIGDTLASVAGQTYANKEYIVIDGGSTDGTLQIIKEYGKSVTRMVSEPDGGIYDAMNKGMRLARGVYLLFLNADDQLASPDILERVFSFQAAADVYFGEAAFVDESGRDLGLRSDRTPHQVPEQLDWKSLRLGMVISHQAFIVRRELSPPFDTRYRICADIDWMIRCLRASRTRCNTHLVISKFRTGGLATRKRRLAWKERYLILSRHYGRIPNFFHHALIVLRWIVSGRQKR